MTVFCETGEGLYNRKFIDCTRISECVKDRIRRGNRAYAANHHMLESKIMKKFVKIQIYETLIRPVVTYGSETLTLTKSDENLLEGLQKKYCG